MENIQKILSVILFLHQFQASKKLPYLEIPKKFRSHMKSEWTVAEKKTQELTQFLKNPHMVFGPRAALRQFPGLVALVLCGRLDLRRPS